MMETVVTSIDRNVRSKKGRVLNNECQKPSESTCRLYQLIVGRYKFSLHNCMLFEKYLCLKELKSV